MQTTIHKTLALVLMSALALTGFFAVPTPADAAGSLTSAQAVSCPSVLLKHWKESSQQEKLSFLFGFVSMLEMEKEWQGDKPLPIRQSINGSWIKGLDGVTLGQMSATLDEYIRQNPDKLDQSVFSVLGRTYVSPILTKEERKSATVRYNQIKAAR